MKIRTDFVTNSSSSSFTCVALYSEDLYNYLQKLIADKKYCEQPYWAQKNEWIQPETELYHEFVFEELQLDRRCYKVQTTEQNGHTKKESVYQYIGSFFHDLSPDEAERLKKLVFEVYRKQNYQAYIYENLTDRFSGFSFKGYIPKASLENDIKSEKAKELIAEIDKLAIDIEPASLSMQGIAIDLNIINGFGIYDPNSERYRQIDKSFLNKIKIRSSGPDTQRLLDEKKKREWGAHLRALYIDAIYETGAIALKKISSKIDCVVVCDLMNGVVSNWAIENRLLNRYGLKSYDEGSKHLLRRGYPEPIKEELYVEYLQDILLKIDKANSSKGRKKPVAVIWESQLHDYLMKHTSLGNVIPEPVVGPHGTIRRKVPKKYKEIVYRIVPEILQKWPSRTISAKTEAYEKLLKEVQGCYKSIGYKSTDEFFDAYGFSVIHVLKP